MNNFDQNDGRKTTALILVAVAAYIILSRSGLLDLFGIGNIISWVIDSARSLVPSAFLLLGVAWLARSSKDETPLAAWAITGLGLVLVISQFDLFGLSFGDMFLPFWLVIIAFMLMNPRKMLPHFLNTPNEELDEDDSRIKLVAFMGGGELDYSSQSLRGGEIVAVWGGYEIDFTNSDMNGDSMELNLCCVMGGVDITVPANWEVEKRNAVCIMGGFSNKTKCLADQLELPRKKLIISGLALMGGGEIKN